MSLYNLPAFPKKVMWQEMLRHELLATLDQRPVVIVPVGSIEQHGPHCPMDVDISTPFHLAVAAAQAIDDFPVIVSPPQQYGFTHYNMGEIGTITLSLETFIATLNDIARSIWANGFRRIGWRGWHCWPSSPHRLATSAASVAMAGRPPRSRVTTWIGSRGRCARQGLGDGYHLHQDPPGPAVSGSRDRFLLTARRGLASPVPHDSRPGPEGPARNRLAAQTPSTRGHDGSTRYKLAK